MTFSAYCKNDSLTSDQLTLAESLDQFLGSSAHAFLMMGGAGTGKTFMLQKLAAYLKLCQTTFHLMAPTGRAAKVLSSVTGCPASTIHRSIYRMDDLKEYKVVDQDGSETYKFFFELANNDDPVGSIYIVDESSMVSNVYSEAEFFRFGSGFLKNDLLEYAACRLPGRRSKIIFCGDPAQLPPVNMNHSPALCADTLHDKDGLNVQAFEMQEVVRQKADSGILQNASALRRNIRTNDRNSFAINPAPDVIPLESVNLLKTWLQARETQSLEQTIIVAWSNRQVFDYNHIIREHLAGHTSPLVVPPLGGSPVLAIHPGDRILVVRNNYHQDIPLLNGEFGEVVATSDHVERETVYVNQPIDGKRNIETVELAFRRVTLRFQLEEGDTVDVNCLINENLINNCEPQPTSLECKALYVDFKNRNKNLPAGTAEFREALCSDPRFNCLQIKYGYAVTAHKAQGGEWEHAFVDFSRGKQSVFCEDYFRWAYTAMTRAKAHLYFMNAPSFSRITATRVIDIVPIENIGDRMLRVPEDAPPPAFPMPEQASWLAALYYAVEEYAKEHNLRITALRHRDYAEDYSLTAPEGKSGVIQIYYDKMPRITRLVPARKADPEIKDHVADLSARIAGYRLPAAMEPDGTTEAQATGQNETPPDHQTLFCRELEQILVRDGIVLLKIAHNGPYHTVCYFASNSETAVINYYFKKNNRLTRALPDPHKSSCPHLIRKILNHSQARLSNPSHDNP